MDYEEMTDAQFKYIVNAILDTVEKEAKGLKDKEEKAHMLEVVEKLRPEK